MLQLNFNVNIYVCCFPVNAKLITIIMLKSVLLKIGPVILLVCLSVFLLFCCWCCLNEELDCVNNHLPLFYPTIIQYKSVQRHERPTDGICDFINYLTNVLFTTIRCQAL